MDAHMKPLTSQNHVTIAVTVIIVIALGIIFLFGIREVRSSIYGVYTIYSNDPAEKLFIARKNTYIKINEDSTIVYNATINGVPKQHFEGTYTQQDNEIIIKWKNGRLPSKLIIEKRRDEQLIKIGSALYKKEIRP